MLFPMFARPTEVIREELRSVAAQGLFPGEAEAPRRSSLRAFWLALKLVLNTNRVKGDVAGVMTVKPPNTENRASREAPGVALEFGHEGKNPPSAGTVIERTPRGHHRGENENGT